MDALRRHAVEPPQRPTERELFTSERSIRDGLAEQGYTDAAVTAYEVRSRFSGVGQFLEWVDSHAGRTVLRRIPAEWYAAAAGEAAAVLGPPGEPIVLITTIRVVVASS